MGVSHFSGLSISTPGQLTYNMPFLDPSKYVTFFTDFTEYVAGDWTITRVGTTPTEALTDGSGGLLLLTMAATDDSSDVLQKKGESFRWVSTKNLFYKARFKISDATQSDFIMGLQITDTTPTDATDGIAFTKVDGTTTCNFLVTKNSTTTTTAAATIVADTFVTLGYHYNPLTSLFHIYVDDVQVATSVTTNAVDDEDITVSILMQNGEAVSKLMTIDYILVALER